MHFLKTPRSLLAAMLLALASATSTDDLESLRHSCESGALLLNASLNNTMVMNTSNIVQDVTWQIGASTANLQDTNSTITTSSNSTTASNSTANAAVLDTPYFDYIDSILTLTEATNRRGLLALHQETNAPVFSALQDLSSAVQTYGMRLANSGLISRDAIIRTFTAGNAIVDAQSTWARNTTTSVLWGGVRRSRIRR